MKEYEAGLMVLILYVLYRKGSAVPGTYTSINCRMFYFFLVSCAIRL